MVTHRCKNCIWWDNQHGGLEEYKPYGGYCRKHKPISVLKGERYIGEWPIVDENDFCGEFRGEN